MGLSEGRGGEDLKKRDLAGVISIDDARPET